MARFEDPKYDGAAPITGAETFLANQPLTKRFSFATVMDWIKTQLGSAAQADTTAFEPSNSNIQGHISDTDIHVTAQDKLDWCDKLDSNPGAELGTVGVVQDDGSVAYQHISGGTPTLRNTKIQIRLGSAADWAAADLASETVPYQLLTAGEFGRNTDNGDLKCGDGVSLWSELPKYLIDRPPTPTIIPGDTTSITFTGGWETIFYVTADGYAISIYDGVFTFPDFPVGYKIKFVSSSGTANTAGLDYSLYIVGAVAVTDPEAVWDDSNPAYIDRNYIRPVGVNDCLELLVTAPNTWHVSRTNAMPQIAPTGDEGKVLTAGAVPGTVLWATVPQATRESLGLATTDDVGFESLTISGVLTGSRYRLYVDEEGNVGTERVL